MKYPAIAIAVLLPAMAFAATSPAPLGNNGGKFGDWTAASYGSGKDKACYAFTPATHSTPAIAGRDNVLLTVTERAGTRDEVTLGAGYTYPKNAKVELTVGGQKFGFYPSGMIAFANSGAAAIAAFKAGNAAQIVATGPHGHDVTDDFSLNGFSDAYNAIAAACP